MKIYSKDSMELTNQIKVDYIYLSSNSSISLNGSILLLNFISLLVTINGDSSICTLQPFSQTSFVLHYILYV